MTYENEKVSNEDLELYLKLAKPNNSLEEFNNKYDYNVYLKLNELLLSLNEMFIYIKKNQSLNFIQRKNKILSYLACCIDRLSSNLTISEKKEIFDMVVKTNIEIKETIDGVKKNG